MAVVSGAASFTNNATTTSSNPNAGTWTITPAAGTLAASNYSFGTFKTGTLTVNKVGLTITANNQTIAYGAAFPTFTATITGFVNPGAFISIYATGLGAVSNPPATGQLASTNPLSNTTATPQVIIDGIPASVTFSGLAPGAVGLYQINAQVPSGTPAGSSVPVVLSIGGSTANIVTIAVQ